MVSAPNALNNLLPRAAALKSKCVSGNDVVDEGIVVTDNDDDDGGLTVDFGPKLLLS